MEPSRKPRGGRPRSFDRDAAVETAMRLFWRHGYEGVSVSDLTSAIGIAAPSLYAAFGSKAELFREALTRYEASQVPLGLFRLEGAATLKEAVGTLLEAGIEATTHPARERGCMISSGMLACHPANEALSRELSRRRDAAREAIASALRRWVDESEADPLARYLAAVMQGISVQARDGASAAELQMIVGEVVSGLRSRRPRG